MDYNPQLLFVDDEPMILQSLSLLFEDYTVLTATSGEDGLKLLAQHPISVIVSDQRMPKMTGVEFLRQAKEIAPHAIRILMTGYSDLDAVINSVNVGEVFRYINKPWQADKLRETIRFACAVAGQRMVYVSQKPATAAAASSVEAKTEYEILFVDSNDSHLKSFQDFFASKYTCHISTTASDALELLRKYPISVVLSDSMLNDSDGADFLIAVRNRHPEVVTILMTSTRDAKTAIKLINDGQVYRYLVKPFPRESLRLTVESAVIHYKVNRENPATMFQRLEDDTIFNSNGTTQSLRDVLSALRQTLDMRSS
ncbi:MAG: hypothetical protein HY22_10190 [[Candidatus Thermochlorobacteriaceae] bacterium GBChlB]|nr:MAG: hypothetical protein HY22_10190 [[Candidatus Thermochlorobacteriaceae] bacterium GBChlB]